MFSGGWGIYGNIKMNSVHFFEKINEEDLFLSRCGTTKGEKNKIKINDKIEKCKSCLKFINLDKDNKEINGKKCKKCGKIQPTSRFVNDRNRRDGKHPYCSNCTRAYIKEHNKKQETKEKIKKYQLSYSRTTKRKQQIAKYRNEVMSSGLTKARIFSLKHNYGISEDEFLIILRNQNNMCVICKKPFKKLSDIQVDHCHKSGKIRGFLCKLCNRALGQVFEDTDILKSMIDYITREK